MAIAEVNGWFEMFRKLIYFLLLVSLIMNAYLGLGLRSLVGSTIYAPGFSETRYQSLACGMTSLQVQEILGLPLEVRRIDSKGLTRERLLLQNGKLQSTTEGISSDAGNDTTKEFWIYSRQGRPDSSYQVRAIEYSADGKINRTWSSLYVD